MQCEFLLQDADVEPEIAEDIYMVPEIDDHWIPSPSKREKRRLKLKDKKSFHKEENKLLATWPKLQGSIMRERRHADHEKRKLPSFKERAAATRDKRSTEDYIIGECKKMAECTEDWDGWNEVWSYGYWSDEWLGDEWWCGSSI